MNTEQDLSEELYNLIAELLNRKLNRTVLDSIRGEYGILRYLLYVENNASAGRLSEHLHVVPGRITDTLNSLERKCLIERHTDPEDRRRVLVSITDAGREQAIQMMTWIHKEYEGMFQILGRKDTEELIRLLKIVLAYPGDEKVND